MSLPSQRDIYLALRALVLHEVASQTMRSSANPELVMKPAERARHNKVTQMLHEGVNPYASTKADDVGGLENDRKLRREEKLNERGCLSLTRHEQLLNKWTERPKDTRVYLGIDMRSSAPAIVTGPTITTKDGRTIPDPDMVCCSFCETWHHTSKVTRGKGPLHKSVKYELVNVGDEQIMQEKVTYSSSRLMACSECVLQIVPTVHKDGSITNNLVFPQRD